MSRKIVFGKATEADELSPEQIFNRKLCGLSKSNSPVIIISKMC